MAKVAINDTLLDAIESLQADDSRGAKESIAFLDNIVSEIITETPAEGADAKTWERLQGLNDIRNYFKCFIKE